MARKFSSLLHHDHHRISNFINGHIAWPAHLISLRIKMARCLGGIADSSFAGIVCGILRMEFTLSGAFWSQCHYEISLYQSRVRHVGVFLRHDGYFVINSRVMTNRACFIILWWIVIESLASHQMSHCCSLFVMYDGLFRVSISAVSFNIISKWWKLGMILR